VPQSLLAIKSIKSSFSAATRNNPQQSASIFHESVVDYDASSRRFSRSEES